jgi:hypothetical protein
MTGWTDLCGQKDNIYISIIATYFSVHMQKKLYWLIVGINRWSFPTFDARLLLPPKEESKMKELIKTNSKLDMGMESEEQSEADEEGKSTTESGSRDHSVNNNKRTTVSSRGLFNFLPMFLI